MKLTRVIKKLEINDALRELKIYGYSSIKNFLLPKTISSLLKFVVDEYNSINNSDFSGYKGVPTRDTNDKIVYNIHNINKLFIDVLSTNPIKAIAMENLNDQYYRFLPNDVPNYVLTYYNARSSGQLLDLHIDSHIPFLGDKLLNMQFVILLEDSTPQNGCTVVVPGSHQSGSFTDRDLKNTYDLTGKAGDLIFWDSRLWHGTRKNISAESRWALIATLGRWWIKPSMDIIRGMNDAIYKACSNEQKQLLGFCSIPPSDPFSRINTKCGYDFLKPSVSDYFCNYE